MNWIIILSFCVPLLLALRNQHAELQKQEKVNKLLEQCVIQGIADCKQMVGNLTHAASELESLKQKNQELAQQSVTSKQSLQILANQSESQLDQELKTEITNLNQRLKSTNNENESLKTDNAELRQQATNLKQENNYLKEEKKTLKANKKELEANKKALIQELGGAVGREDLEYATWDFVLQTTQLLVKERDEALKDNNSLQQKNNQLESQNASQRNDISHLKSEIFKKESELNNLQRYQSNSNDNHQLDSLRNQLINLNKQLSESKQFIANLNKELQNKDTILNQLTQEKLKLDKVIQDFEERLRKKEASIDSLNCENRDLKQSVVSLKDNIKNLHLQSNPQIEMAQIQELLGEIKNLNQEITELKSNENSRKTYPSIKHPEDTLDILTEFDYLVYFVQDYCNVSGLEEIDEWRRTQRFYFSLVKQLYSINVLLVSRVMQLEENLNEAYCIGKAICWNNKIITEELSMILSNNLF